MRTRQTNARWGALLIALLFMTSFFTPLQAQQNRTQRLRQHLYLLASDSLEGRKAGSEGGLKARQYIIDQYQRIGLQPYGASLTHTFPKPHSPIAIFGPDTLKNIVAIIPGNDPQLKDEYIVLGAHYDHIGVKNGQVHNGADDNASGSTALIEIARDLYAHRSELKRSIIIAAFDAEEEGLYGSKALVEEMTANGDIAKVHLMMSIDMVGWYQANDNLTMEGSGTLQDAEGLMERIAAETGINIKAKRFEHSLLTATDTQPFAQAGCPTLAVTTGLESPYHKPEDDADLIDYEGLDRICQYLTTLTLRWADGSEPLSASGRLAAKHRSKSSLLEWGVTGAIGNAGLSFPGSTLTGKRGISAMVGLAGRWNMAEHLALQADLLFNLYRLPYPNLDGSVTDVFADRQARTFCNITIPLTLLLTTGSRDTENGYLGVGVFYSPMFNSDNQFQSKFLAGPHWCIGYHSHPIDISVMTLYNINNVESSTLPKIHSVHTHAVLTFYL